MTTLQQFETGWKYDPGNGSWRRPDGVPPHVHQASEVSGISSSGSSPILLAYLPVTSPPSGFSAETDIGSVTVTVPAGRTLKVTAQMMARGSNANEDFRLQVYQDGVRIGLDDERIIEQSGTGGQFRVIAITSPSAGRHTYKFTFARIGGTGTAFITGSNPDWPHYILVEDITGTTLPYASTSVPVGLLAQLPVTAGASGSGLVTVGTVSVTVPAGRVLRVLGMIRQHTHSVVNGRSTLRIYEDGAFKTSVLVIGHPTVAGNAAMGGMVEYLASPSAGSHTYTFAMNPEDAGTISFAADPTYPAYISVEDITPTPAASTSAPSGVLAFQPATADQGSITTQVALTGLSATVTVPAGRTLRIEGVVLFKNTAAGNQQILTIQQDGANIRQAAVVSSAANVTETVIASQVVSPSAGTHTYQLLGQAAAGTTTMSAGASNQCYISVEDITGVSVNPTAIVPGAIVANSSARPASPSVGAMIYEPDTGMTRVWTGSSWGLVVPQVVTSSTRPSGPTSGETVFETDTGLMKYWNGSNWVTQANLRWFGTSAALVGSPPAIDAGNFAFKMQGGTSVVTTDGSGDFTLTFPTAFPNGLLTCMLTPGYTGIGAHFLTIYDSAMTLSSVKAHVWGSTGAAAANTTLRFSYLAFGW